MLKRSSKANVAKSQALARIEHDLAQQKDRASPFICTVGISNDEANITLANLAQHTHSLIMREPRVAMGWAFEQFFIEQHVA